MAVTTASGPVYFNLGQNWVYPFAIPQGKDVATVKKSQWIRVDQGVDLQCKDNKGVNPVYAACDGRVRIQIHPGHEQVNFGPNYPWLQFDTPLDIGLGKDNFADGIYYGHVITAAGITDGDPIKKGDHIADTTNPSMGNAWTTAAPAGGWLEIGYWKADRGPVAPLVTNPADTPAGHQMDADLGGAVPTGSPAADPSGSTGSGNAAGNPTGHDFNSDLQNAQAWANAAQTDLPDPRNNLPFSPMFMGLVIGSDFTTGNPRFALAGGPATVVRPLTGLVRGGIQEIVQSRPRGPFSCYFMINPDSIAYSNSIQNSISPPTTNSDTTNAVSTWMMTSQSVSFTIYFNRQYEVWSNQVPAISQNSPGPSAIGVRYDIRAFERLLGMYDGTVGTFGNSINSPQSAIAQATPLQVVFGGPNSLQFQGRLTEMDYTYTKFDHNMIPIECMVDVTMLRIINPPKNDLMINGLIQGTPSSIASPLLPANVQFDGSSGGTPVTASGLPPNQYPGAGQS